MAASITNRATGVALYAGWLVFAGWALALSAGADAYQAYTGLLTSPLGLLVLIGVTASLFFHLGAGVRHLAWDLGRGFAKTTASATAWFSYVFALLATILVWVAAFAAHAG
jgi:succinate dehydrogenase / fumarate reductase cytochrome b subunit